MRHTLLGLLAAVLAASCSPPAPPADASDAGGDAGETGGMDALIEDTGPAPTCDGSGGLAMGSAMGHPMPLAAAAGQARAGRIAAADLPADPTGLATWRGNDFVLANNRVAVIIEDARASDLYDPWGGKVAGVARVSGGRLVAPADFNEMFVGLGRHVVATERVTVMSDGASGGPAVVRAEGPLRPIPFIDEFGRAIAPADYRDLRAAIDYSLAPDSDEVEVAMTIDVTRARAVAVPVVLHAFFQRSRMPRFVPGGPGFGTQPDTALPYVAFALEGQTAYAWFAGEGMLTPLISVSGFDAYQAAAFQLPACAQTRRVMGRMVVGGAGNGIDGLLQSVARARMQMQREIRGTVSEMGGAPAVGVRVHATSADGNTYFTRAVTDATGAFALHVPAGQAARLTAVREGNAPVGPVDVPAAQGTAMLTLGPTGTIRVRVTEAPAMRAVPARVQVLPVTGAVADLPAAFAEPQPGNGRLHIVFPTDGVAELRAPAGRWRVIASRGSEYEIAQSEVMVNANEPVDVPLAVRRSVDTAGMLCGDMHVHTNRSPDASDPARFKLAAIAGEGIELAVRSDHEFVADFAPLVAEMGLAPFLVAVPSLELTTFAWGHMGVIPFTPNPMARNGGVVDWVGRLPPAVFDEVRRLPSAPTIIINHPRSDSTIEGYFRAAEYNPDTNTAGRPMMWDTQFTAVEFFNDSSFEQNRNSTVRDWFGFLRGGRRVFAVGSSDSHNILPGSPVGYPRTCLALGHDDVAMATPAAVRDAIAQGRSVVNGGVHVTAEVMGRGPGQEAMGVGAMASVRVTVQAPAWVAPETLEVIVDGMTAQTITLDASTADPGNPTVRFRRDVMVPVAAGGSFVIFAVNSTRDLAPVYPRRQAFGVTNPIFLRR